MPFTINGTTGINLGTQPLTGSLPDANAPSGSVIQVVQNSSTTIYTTTSTSYQACTNHTVTITPSSASNKILIMHQGMVNNQTTSSWCWATMYRNGVNLYAGGANDASGGVYDSASGDTHNGHTMIMLDSPNTTSAVTYTVYFKSGTGASVRYNADGWKLYIVAMEISA
jgi:hypothetical protein